MSELIPLEPKDAPPKASLPSNRALTEPARSSTSQRPWTARIVVAMLVAVGADSAGILPGEALPIVFDLVVCGVLSLILGPQVAVFGALVLEAIPGVGVFPSWVAAVAWVAFAQGSRKQ